MSTVNEVIKMLQALPEEDKELQLVLWRSETDYSPTEVDVVEDVPSLRFGPPRFRLEPWPRVVSLVSDDGPVW